MHPSPKGVYLFNPKLWHALKIWHNLPLQTFYKTPFIQSINQVISVICGFPFTFFVPFSNSLNFPKGQIFTIFHLFQFDSLIKHVFTFNLFWTFFNLLIMYKFSLFMKNFIFWVRVEKIPRKNENCGYYVLHGCVICLVLHFMWQSLIRHVYKLQSNLIYRWLHWYRVAALCGTYKWAKIFMLDYPK